VLDGIDDWRIPTVDELLSIADRSNYPKIVDGFEYVQPGPYWTSNPKNDTDAYIVDFHSGLESGYVNKNQYGGLYIRCISNGDGAGSSQSSSSEQASSSSVGQQEECLYSNVQIATEIKYGTYNEAVEYCQSQGLMLPDLDQMNIVYESLDRVHPENAVGLWTNTFVDGRDGEHWMVYFWQDRLEQIAFVDSDERSYMCIQKSCQ
jgi:hypothetical protein